MVLTAAKVIFLITALVAICAPQMGPCPLLILLVLGARTTTETSINPVPKQTSE